MDRIEPTEALHGHLVDALRLWTYRVPNTRTAVLPPHTQHPNPLVIGDSVVASVFSPGAIYSVHKATGELQWFSPLDTFAGAQVVSADGRIFAKSSRTLYCLDTARGTPLWSFSPLPNSRETIYSCPTYHDDRVFIGDRAGMFHCLDAASGRLLWANKLSTERNNQVNATAAIQAEIVVVACNAGVIAAYDISTGHMVWQQSIDGPCITEILAQGGEVFAPTPNSIYALDAATGQIAFRKHWPSFDVGAVTLCRESVVSVLLDRTRRDAERPRAELTAFQGTSDLFHVPAAEFVVGIRFHQDSGLIFESRLDGLGIVDPATGRRLHNIYRDDDLFGCGLVDVHEDRIYAMDMGGAIYALRSPMADDVAATQRNSPGRL